MSKETISQQFRNLVQQADDNLLKELNKLLNRIERLMVPTYFYSYCHVADRLEALRKRLANKEFILTTSEFTPENIVKAASKLTENFIRRVDWESLETELRDIIGNHPDDAFYLKEVNGEIVHQRRAHTERYESAIAKEKIRQMQIRNNQPVMTGKWRKEPFPPRTRVQLTDYVPTDSISPEEGQQIMEQLNTPLNGYLGQAYNYDDRGLTEEWMTSFRNGTTAASEEEVTRTQLVSLMEIMLSKVQDRIYNEEKILEKPPIMLSKDVVEQPVWGMDSYTRKMVEICLEDRVPQSQRSTLTIKDFIEHTLLPAINRQSPEKAHNISFAFQSIIDSETSSARDRLYATTMIESFQQFGFDMFKVHPKGTGVVCVNPNGIPPQVLIAEYLGELYPAYRWCERLDVIEQAQKQLEMKPTLPDFYNILLERPRHDPNGYGLLYVDASQKANIGSSCSHSCDANCTSSIVARNGRLSIAMTTNRHVRYGEELTFDYYSITTSDVEWRAAVCLCGMTSCRGSFLAYATQEDLQQVLNQNFGPVSRYASLLRACADRKPSSEDTLTLARHGIKQAILGSQPPNWVTKYAADILRFVEFERKALPCSLLRPREGMSDCYTFSGADMDARCVMEQRIQSMVCCFSMINRLLMGQKQASMSSPLDDCQVVTSTGEKKPLQPIMSRQVLPLIWTRLCKIPVLVNEYMLNPVEKTPETKAIRGKKAEVEALLAELREVLREEPTSMASVREACITIRRILLKYQSLSYSKARLVQLSDVLALWAFTVNFSVPQEYDVVEAAPIQVPARELGSTVPRSVLDKARSKERDRERKERRMLAGKDHQFFDEIESMMKKTTKKSSPSTVTANTSVTDLQTLSSDIVPETSVSVPQEQMPSNHIESEESMAVSIGQDSAMDVVPDSSLTTSSDEVVVAHDDVVTHVKSITSVEDSTDNNVMDVCAPDSVVITHCVTPSETEPEPEEPKELAVENVEVRTESTTEEALDSTISVTSIPTATNTGRHTSQFLDPNEPVFTGRKIYDKWFCFWQLMDWFNAGSDQKTEHPDLFGCVELPDPVACFGTASVVYGPKHQEMLIKILKDDKLQAMNWPQALRSTFNIEKQEAMQLGSERVYGSPMLDVVLGQVDSVAKALREIISTAECVKEDEKAAKNGKAGGRGKKVGSAEKEKKSKEGRSTNQRRNLVEEDRQLDEILAPEAPTNWVQCDACHKWRRVPWHVDLEALPDPWTCEHNTWDIDTATCAAPQDTYDASKENAMYDEQENTFVLEDFTPGSWWDVYCTKNLVYYEGQIVRKREPSGKKKGQPTELLVHYKGWSSSFDEWIPFDSERFVRHNLFTNPMASDPREQERWQGMQPVSAVVKSAYKVTKKRKSNDGTDASGKKAKMNSGN